MKLRDKSPVVKDLISSLYRAGKKVGTWDAAARGLNRPRRVRFEVQIANLNKVKGNILVPGSVLGNGTFEGKKTVAALRFSARAKEKIEKAGGKAISIEELMKEHPRGKGITVIG